MRVHARFILPWLPERDGKCWSFAAVVRFIGCSIGVAGMFFAVLFGMAPVTAVADESAARSAADVDARWLPWIGAWRMVSDADRETDKNSMGDYILEILPGGDRQSVTMKSFRDDKLLLETRIAADGSRQALQDTRCSGWYQYSWSQTGKRLLFNSEAGCPAELPRTISGISVITDNGEWLDIQLLKSGEDRAISVRKYRAASEAAGSVERIGPNLTGTPRYLAATSLSVDEVIELSGKIPSGLLEAAIAELQKPFNINSNTLKRLSNAGVEPQIVDLMVALSFPDKFRLNQRGLPPVRQAQTFPERVFYDSPYVWLPFGYWSVYGPYSSWYWGTPIYGYWGPGWDWYPIGGGGGGRRDNGGGRLINDRGFSRVEPGRREPRYAQPRGYSGSSSGGNYQVSPRSSSPPPAASTGGGSQGSVSGGSSSRPSVSTPGASPGGFHSGSGGSGGQAKPRD